MSRGSALGVLVLLLAAGPLTVFAQNNSLLGRRPAEPARTQPAPTTQPAQGQDPLLRTTAVQARTAATLSIERPSPKANETLLRASPFAVGVPEPERIRVHDLITIIVRESKTATSDAKLKSKKTWSLETELSKWIKLSDKHGLTPAALSHGNPAIEFDFENDYAGNGKYDRKDELVTRLTARVIDVKPNGNLVLEARKSIFIDNDGYTITVTGECRSTDVTPQNTILSTQVADPEIHVNHSGAVRDATRRGWLMRGLDFLRPF